MRIAFSTKHSLLCHRVWGGGSEILAWLVSNPSATCCTPTEICLYLFIYHTNQVQIKCSREVSIGVIHWCNSVVYHATESAVEGILFSNSYIICIICKLQTKYRALQLLISEEDRCWYSTSNTCTTVRVGAVGAKIWAKQGIDYIRFGQNIQNWKFRRLQDTENYPCGTTIFIFEMNCILICSIPHFQLEE